MYTVCVVAPAGAVRPDLLAVLEQEELAYIQVPDATALAQLPVDQSPHAVLWDASSSVGDHLSEVADKCRAMHLPLLVALSPETLAQKDFSEVVDDFILCPPRLGELRARVHQALARQAGQTSGETVRVGDLVIDVERYEVHLAGRKVLLTFKEYQLLKLLAMNPGRVYSREALLSQIWGYDYFGGTRTVDVHIRRLRSKIEDADHSFIETVWTVGYRLRG